MKALKSISLITLILILSGNLFSQKVPSKGELKLSFKNEGDVIASIKNSSLKEVEISIIDEKTKKQIRGFGLNAMGKADVLVEKTSYLLVSNKNDKAASISVKTRKNDLKPVKNHSEYVSFTLLNSSNKSIPLSIPSVMNPNLSPNSKSGVNLKYGQEIIYKSKGKKIVLLKVNDSIKEGDVIDVYDLIQKL